MFGHNIDKLKTNSALKAVYRVKHYLKWLKIKCRSSELQGLSCRNNIVTACCSSAGRTACVCPAFASSPHAAQGMRFARDCPAPPRVVVSTAAFHAVRGSVPGLGGLKETKNVSSPSMKVSIVGSLRDGEVACSASDRQGSNFKSCVWRTVSSQSSHHPQEVLLTQFSLYVHKGGLKPDSFHFMQHRANCPAPPTGRHVIQSKRIWRLI